jgi:hypothetical protein
MRAFESAVWQTVVSLDLVLGGLVLGVRIQDGASATRPAKQQSAASQLSIQKFSANTAKEPLASTQTSVESVPIS